MSDPTPASALSLKVRTARIDRGTPQALPEASHHRDGGLSIEHYTCHQQQFTDVRGGAQVIAFRQSRLPTPTTGLPRSSGSSLYTPEERRRRDESPWTIVQAVLAPVQFITFLVSLALVVRYLVSGDGLALATGSVVVKTLALYAIMITGSIWEKAVFGRYLFARAFFWEDVFSILVLALHTAYLVALASDALTPRSLLFVALAAYAAYVINATQFLLKLRAARLNSSAVTAAARVVR
jgi:3-vinyl bacteriochlorophyllide hydratase